MIYVNYDYYASTFYGNKIVEKDFPRYALRASQFLDYYTHGKAKDNAGLDAIKMACCDVAECFFAGDFAVNSSKGVKSESVGSYSVSYETGKEKIETAQATRAECAAVAREYLADTGLLYRGGGRC